MGRRVVLGRHNNGNFGLYVSDPLVDAYYGNTASRTDYVFSSDWPDSIQFIMAGTAVINTWITLPSYITFWPHIQGEIQIASNQYRSMSQITDGSSGSNWLYYHTYRIQYQTSGTARQFRVANQSGTGATIYRYFATNLVVAT